MKKLVLSLAVLAFADSAFALESMVGCFMKKNVISDSGIQEGSPVYFEKSGAMLTAEIDGVEAEVVVSSPQQIDISIKNNGRTANVVGGIDSTGELTAESRTSDIRYKVICKLL